MSHYHLILWQAVCSRARDCDRQGAWGWGREQSKWGGGSWVEPQNCNSFSPEERGFHLPAYWRLRKPQIICEITLFNNAQPHGNGALAQSQPCRPPAHAWLLLPVKLGSWVWDRPCDSQIVAVYFPRNNLQRFLCGNVMLHNKRNTFDHSSLLSGIWLKFLFHHTNLVGYWNQGCESWKHNQSDIFFLALSKFGSLLYYHRYNCYR